MRLLTKIFGNRDDTETAPGEGSDDGSLERETIELEPYELSAADLPRATTEQSGRVTFAPPESESAADVAGSDGAGGRRRRRRHTDIRESSEEQPHELTRRRIARPTTSTFEPAPTPPPIPVGAAETEDPEEIDVSDQLDDVHDAEADLDASADLIIEDDESIAADEDDEDTSTGIAWGAASPTPASSPAAAPEAPVADASSATSTPEPAPAQPAVEAGPIETALDQAPLDAAAREQQPRETAASDSGSLTPDTTQPDPERTSMATDTKTPKQTLVAAGTEFTGTLKSSCPVIVDGKLEGEVDVPTLSVTRTGSIFGTIRAKTLRSSGTLAGKVDAGEVYVSGAVRSKTVIRARRLELQLGSSGESQIEVTLGPCELDASDASSPSEASDVHDTTEPSDGAALGSGGWDLPEPESRVGLVQASSQRTTSK